MRMGDLNEKIDFKREAMTASGFDGSLSKGVTTVRDNVWASIGFVGSPSAGSSEEEIDGQRTGKMKIEVVCRYYTNMNLRFDDIIEWNGARFAIYSIQYIGKKKGYALRAELRDDNTNNLP